MAKSEKDEAAKRVADLRATFDLALSDKRKYPMQEFRAFVQSVRRYIEVTANDPMIHKSVARAVNGLRNSWKWSGREFPPISCLRQIDSNPSFSVVMILRLTGMNLRACRTVSAKADDATL